MAQEKQSLTDVLQELNGGVFLQSIERGMRDAAANSTTHRKAASISIKFSMKPIGDSNQVELSYFLETSIPTSKNKGVMIERGEASQPVYVGVGGMISTFPWQSGDLLKEIEGKTNER